MSPKLGIPEYLNAVGVTKNINSPLLSTPSCHLWEHTLRSCPFLSSAYCLSLITFFLSSCVNMPRSFKGFYKPIFLSFAVKLLEISVYYVFLKEKLVKINY